MAADTSEPRSGLILQIALLTVVTLVGVRYALVSYFNVQMSDEYGRKIANKNTEQLVALRAEEHKLLSSGSMPIDKAMAMVASRGREGLGAQLAAKPSDDTAALTGWSQLPRTGTADGGAARVEGSAGAAPSGPAEGSAVDGGATQMLRDASAGTSIGIDASTTANTPDHPLAGQPAPNRGDAGVKK